MKFLRSMIVFLLTILLSSCSSIPKSEILSGQQETTSGYINNFGYFLEANKKIYFNGDPNGLYMMNLDGSEITKVIDKNVWNLKTFDERIYFIDTTSSMLCSMNYDSSDLKELFSANDYLFTTSGGYFYSDYFNEGMTGGLKYINSKGVETKLYDFAVSDLQLYNGYLYFLTANSFELYRININQQSSLWKPELINTFATDTRRIIGQDYIYTLSDKVYYLPIDLGREDLLAERSIGAFAINNGWIYYVAAKDPNNTDPETMFLGELKKMRSDGTEVTTLTELDGNYRDYFVYPAGSYLYLTGIYSEEYNKIFKVNPNTGKKEILNLP